MNLFQDIFTYAFRGNGIYNFVIGTVLLIISYFVAFAPIIGLIAYPIIISYLCATYFKLIVTSANGRAEADATPDTANPIADLLFPMLKVIVIVTLSFGPFLWYSSSSGNTVIEVCLLLAGIIYAPMAMLSVVMLDYLREMNPMTVIPAIFRAGKLYLVAVTLLITLYLVESFIIDSISFHWGIEVALTSLLSMYTLMTNARILGLIYRERKEEIGWA